MEIISEAGLLELMCGGQYPVSHHRKNISWGTHFYLFRPELQERYGHGAWFI
jgi:hypothetical protein